MLTALILAAHSLFVWTGDADNKGNDFLVVIDGDPASPKYGALVTSLATEQQTKLIHHTEYTMPASGMLFANDHYAGRTFIFDLRDALHPRIAASFTDMAGYMHPHSFVRLPNGHVLASFQHAHHGDGSSGGLVEIDDAGKVVRSASAADPAFSSALLTPYSLAVLPELDRVVSTNSSMHLDSILLGATYQVWRLSDLKLLRTAYFDVPEDRVSHVSPEEPRVGPDGAVYVQTLACGLERITGLEKDAPVTKLVWRFPGNWCGVPSIAGHYLIQSVPALHALVAIDLAGKPAEVSRLELSPTFKPHWTAWDPATKRIVVTGNESRLFLVKLDPATGALTMDEAFHDAQGKPGFELRDRDWPHGWHGSGMPHGAVFSR